MAETHSLRAEIDASGARRGAADFESAIRKIGNAVRALDRTTDRAFSKINRNVGSVSFSKMASDLAKVSNALTGFDRSAVDSFAKLSRAVSGFRGASPAAIASVRNLSSAFASLQHQSAGQVVQALNSITTAARAARTAMQGLGSASGALRVPSTNTAGGRAGTSSAFSNRAAAYQMRGFERAVSVPYQAGSIIQGAIGAASAGSLLQQVFTATDSLQKFRAALLATGDSGPQVERQMEAVQRAVRDFGLDLFSIREQFASFNAAVRASGVSGEQATIMFQNAALAMRNMGIGPQQQEGALRAISQMFGKGRIMSEELFQQMSEHWTTFPGILAQTLGINMAQLRERMQKETLNPRVIAQVLENARILSEGAAATVSGRMRTSAEQVRTAWRDLMATLGEGPAGQAMVGMFERLRDILRSEEFVNFAQRFGVGLADLITKAGDAMLWMGQNTDKVATAMKALLALSAINFFGGLAGAVTNLITPVARLTTFLWGLTAAQGAAAGAGAASGGLGSVFGAAVGSANALGAVAGRLLTFLTGPFGGAALAVGAIGTAMYENRDAVVQVGGQVTTLGNLFKTVFSDTLSAAETFGKGLVDMLRPYFAQLGQSFQQTFSSLFADERRWGGQALNWLLGRTDENAIRSSFNSQRLQVIREGQEALRQLDVSTNGGRNTSDGGTSYRTARQQIQAVFQARIDDINKAAEDAVAAYRRSGDTPGLRTLGITPQQAEASRSITLNTTPMNPAERAAAEQAQGESAPRLPNSRPLVRPDGNPWSDRPGRGGRNEREQFEAFRAQLDPGFRVQNDLATGMRDLAAAQQRGWLTAQQRLDLEQRLRDSILETVQALDPRTKAENQLREATQLLAPMQERGLITEDQRAQRLEVIRRRLEDNIDPMGAMLRQIEEETNLTRLSTREMEIEGEVRQRVQRLREQGVNLSEAETDQLRTALRLQRQMTQAQQDREAGLATWANGFRSIGVEVAKLEEKIANDLSGALADFVTTGKANFSDLATSIVNDVNRVIIQQGLREFLRYLGIINGSVKDGFTNGSGGGLVGTIAGWLGGGGGDAVAGAGTADAIGNAVGSFLGAGAFAEGGYATNPVTRGLMPATAWVGAPHYAEGTANTRGGIPAVLHPNEAVIPLSRGRRVPVEMKGGGASPISVTMNIATPDANSFRKSQGQIATEAGMVIARSARRNG